MRFLLLLSLSMIFFLGLVMIFSTTSAEVLDHELNLSTHFAIYRQIIYACIGGIAGLVVWRIGYRSLLQLSPVLLVGLILLLFLVFVPGIGRSVNGSHRWIALGKFTLQPSEFGKIVLPLYAIYRMRLMDMTVITLKEFILFLIPIGVATLLILVEPDNGTVGVIGLVMLVLFLLSRVPVKYWMLPLLGVGIVVGGFASQLPYVKARLNVYMNPELDLKGRGHQPHQAKIAAGSGMLFGKGPGNSWQKLSYLPEAQNDYIAAIFAEEFGFLGILLLVSLYMFIGYLGYAIAHHAGTLEGFYLAGSMTFLLVFQAFLNLGVVSGLLPSTGLNLPFFSQGGSSLIANMIVIGLLMSVREEEMEIV